MRLMPQSRIQRLSWELRRFCSKCCQFRCAPDRLLLQVSSSSSSRLDSDRNPCLHFPESVVSQVLLSLPSLSPAQVFSFGTHEYAGQLPSSWQPHPSLQVFLVSGRARAKMRKKARLRAIRRLECVSLPGPRIQGT